MELLEKIITDLKLNRKSLFKNFDNLTDDDICKIIELINYAINNSEDVSNKKNGGFNFIANSTLSGSPFPCEDISCRLDQVYNLSRNSILYADTVFIQNPFQHYLKYKTFNDKLKLNILQDLIILNTIQPLIKEGIFKFVKDDVHFCSDCYKTFQNKYLNERDWNIQVIEKLLEEYIYQHVDFNLILSHEKKCVEISGGNDLLKHPLIISFYQYIPHPLDSILIKNDKIKLSPEMIKESKIIYFILDEFINNLCIQDFYSKFYSAHVLTNREFDIKLIDLINNKGIVTEVNLKRSSVLNSMGHFVPFIENVSVDKLIKLRRNEGEAFQVYRDKINKIAKLDSLNSLETRDLYNDEIRPEINRINLSIKNNKKLLWGNVKSNIILATTYVSVSLYSGILPSNITNIVASIGGFGFASSISQDLIKMIKKPSIRDNEMYFLWKLKEDNKIEI